MKKIRITAYINIIFRSLSIIIVTYLLFFNISHILQNTSSQQAQTQLILNELKHPVFIILIFSQIMYIILWVGVIKHIRAFYLLSIIILSIYTIAGLIGLFTGSAAYHNSASNGLDSIPFLIMFCIILGGYIHLIEIYIEPSSDYWFGSLMSIVVSALPLWVLISERHLFAKKAVPQQTDVFSEKNVNADI